jgi:hypothetical protein
VNAEDYAANVAARRAEIQRTEEARRRRWAALTAHGEVTRSPEEMDELRRRLDRLARRASGLPDDAALPDLDEIGGGPG